MNRITATMPIEVVVSIEGYLDPAFAGSPHEPARPAEVVDIFASFGTQLYELTPGQEAEARKILMQTAKDAQREAEIDRFLNR